RVLVTGGHSFESYMPDLARQTPVGPTEVIDLQQQQVTLGGALVKPRWGHAVALHPGGAVVIAGGADGFLPGIDAAELAVPSHSTAFIPSPPRECPTAPGSAAAGRVAAQPRATAS